MLDFFKPLFEFLKLAPRYLIAIGLVAGLVIFGSDQFRMILGLSKFAEDYRPILGILFLSSIILLIVAIAGNGWRWTQRAWRKRKVFQSITKRLNNLTEDEKQILRYYITNNTRSNTLRIENGVVSGLVSAGIIYQSTSLGNVLEGFAHNIGDVAWEYLNVCPHLLEGSTTVCRTDKRTRLGY